jgi:hypothetical protein
MLYTRRATLGIDDGIDDRHTIGTDLTLATPRFLGDKSLDTGVWFVHTSKAEGTVGGNNAYGWRARFPNDPWSGGVSFREFPGAYDAAIGFTPRRNFREWSPDIGYAPRLSNHPFIRGFEFEAGADIVTDLHGRWITRESDFTPFAIEFHSGDSVEFQLFSTSERLETDFEIEDGIVFPVGSEHSWTRYQLTVETASNRKVSGRFEYSDGGFWSGNRRETTLEMELRPRPGVFLQLSTEYNDVDLAEGSFSTRLYRVDARTQFSPWISLANNIQYDSESRVVGWQMRFRWILKPGDDVFFVYSQNWLDDRLMGMNVIDQRGVMKVVRTWRF